MSLYFSFCRHKFLSEFVCQKDFVSDIGKSLSVSPHQKCPPSSKQVGERTPPTLHVSDFLMNTPREELHVERSGHEGNYRVENILGLIFIIDICQNCYTAPTPSIIQVQFILMRFI